MSGAVIWSSAGKREDQAHRGTFFARQCALPHFGNIEGELWTKLVWNCALNAVSALGRAKYGLIASSPMRGKLLRRPFMKYWPWRGPLGYIRPDWKIEGGVGRRTQDCHADGGGAFLDRADMNRGKRTEIDSLNGYISRRGRNWGFLPL